MKTKFTLTFLIFALTLNSQSFYSPDPSQNAGPLSQKVNIMLLSDGYLAGDLSLFEADVLDFYREFVITTPFKEYLHFFNVFGSFVASTSNGPTHPFIDVVCETNAPPVTDPDLHNTSFGSSLDNFGIHRGLTCDFNSVTTYLNLTVFDGQIIYPIVFVKSSEWAALANIALGIATVSARYSVNIIPGQNAYDERITIHELAHSFGKLQDEYYFPCPLSPSECEIFDDAPNRTDNDDFTNDTHPWHHWESVATSPAIGNFSHRVIPQCPNPSQINGAGNVIYGDEVDDLYKPTTNYQCIMESITRPFCAVCREALVMRVYDEVTPINSFTPSDLDGEEFNLSSSQNFELNLTIPVRTDLGAGNNYKSMKVTWEIINDEDENVFIQVQEEPNSMNLGSGEFFYSLNASGEVCELFNELEAGSYKIKAIIRDRAGLSDELTDNTRWVRHPEANHNWEVVWNVKYSGIPGTDLFAKDVAEDLGIEPNTISGYIWESEDIWLCNDIAEECEDNEAPLYLGDPTEVQVNLWIQNRGCKVFNHETDEGTVNFHWAKASTDLEWPISWNGALFNPNPQLRGDLIEVVDIDEDIDIAGERVRVSTNWSLPDPNDYNELFNGVDFNHFCLLARIDSENDPLIELSTLYANVKNSNNIVWKNITIIDETSMGGGISLSDDVVKGASVIVGNSRATNANFKLQFSVPNTEIGKPITEEAEVRITLSDSLWQRWMDGGQQAYEVDVYNASRRQLILKSDSSYIANIAIDSFMNMGMYVSVNFLTRERSSKELFTLRAIQILDDSTQQILGGETYVIKPDPYRAYFTADAGEDKEVIIGNAFSQSAKAIADSAIYNWYNASGVKLHTGITLSDSATTTSTETYKLEVIAKEDGYKDYDEVTITTKLGKLTTIHPNPISNGSLSIGYLVANSVSAPKIRIVNIHTSVFSEHNISTGAGTLNVDISAYAAGSYSIILICDSTAVDDELLIVQ